MKVVRVGEGRHYDPPGHWGCWPLRIHGKEESGTQGLMISYAHFLPGGGGKDDGAPIERVYYILSGSITIKAGGEEATLNAGDSVYRPANEPGVFINNGVVPSTNLVIIVPTS